MVSKLAGRIISKLAGGVIPTRAGTPIHTLRGARNASAAYRYRSLIPMRCWSGAVTTCLRRVRADACNRPRKVKP